MTITLTREEIHKPLDLAIIDLIGSNNHFVFTDESEKVIAVSDNLYEMLSLTMYHPISPYVVVLDGMKKCVMVTSNRNLPYNSTFKIFYDKKEEVKRKCKILPLLMWTDTAAKKSAASKKDFPKNKKKK